jgi:hypothetical protein
MKVFISWSGPKSKQMSIILRNWLPLVFPHLEFFISSEIEKGSNFLEVILKQLKDSSIGIFLLTKGNVSAQWIQFEAGAFASKGVESKICPIFLDDEIQIDETGPLRFYQGSLVNEKDIFKLLDSINNSLPAPFAKEILIRMFNSNKDEFFDNWELIKNIPTTDKMGMRTNRDFLAQIYQIVFDSRITSERALKNMENCIKAFETKFEAKIGISEGPPPIVRPDLSPCNFAEGIEMLSGMAKFTSRFPYGGDFSSTEAWKIALGDIEYEYRTTSNP